MVRDIIVSNIDAESDMLLQSSLEKLGIEPNRIMISPKGAAGKVKREGVKPNTLFVILDSVIWDEIYGKISSVLDLPKCHRYTDVESFRRFLSSQLGSSSEDSGGAIEEAPSESNSNVGIQHQKPIYDDSIEEGLPEFIDNTESDPLFSDVVEEPEFMSGGTIDGIMSDADFSGVDLTSESNNSVEVDKLNAEIQSQREELEQANLLIKSLESQLSNRSDGTAEDVRALTKKIRELKSQLEEKDAVISKLENDSYVAIGKVAKAEKSIDKVKELEVQLGNLKKDYATLETKYNSLVSERDELNSKLEGSEASLAELMSLREQVEHLNSDLDKAQHQVSIKEAELDGKSDELSAKISEIETLNSNIESLNDKIADMKEHLGVLQSEKKESDKDSVHAQERVVTLTNLVDKLKGDISGRDDTIVEYEDEIERLSKELNSVNTQLIQASSNQKLELEGSASKIAELESALNSAKSDYAKLSSQAEVAQTEYDSLISEHNDVITDLESVTEELEVVEKNYSELESKYKTEVEQLNTQLSEAKGEVKKSETMVASMTEELASINKQYADLKKQYDESMKQANDLSSKLSGVSSKNAEEYAAMSSKVVEVNEKLRDAESTVKTLESDLNIKSDEFEDMKSKYEFTKTSYNNVKSELDDLRTQYESLKNSQVTKDGAISSKQKEIDRLNAKLQDAKQDVEERVAENDKLKERYSELSDKLIKKSTELTEMSNDMATLNEEKVNLGASLKNSESKRKKLQSEVEELTSRVESLMSDNESLRGRVNTIGVSTDVYDDLQSQNESLTDEVERLTDEVKELREKAKEETNTAPLRLEIVELKEKIKKLNHEKTVASTGNANELKRIRKRNTELETELAEVRQELDGATSGVYAQIQGSALPKVKLGVSVAMPNIKLSNFFVVAGGSTSSNLDAYRLIRKSCAKNGRKTLILDLSVDSYIDSEFKAKNIQTPLGWLSGEEPLKKFVASTALPNVKVMSVGLAYLNTAYLLEVDWITKLKELNGKADNIVIYVGCLNDMVSRILYQSFTSVMQGYIVVNATPINIRTVLLILVGMGNVQNSVVYCANYDNISKQMYERLSRSYSATIVSDMTLLTFS